MIFILVGPSGSGKTTIMQKLLERNDLGLQRVITTTTRAPRPGEQDGNEYWFLTKEAFEQGLKQGDFDEWIEGFGNYYGTSRKEIEGKLALGPLLIVTDMPGALKLRALYPHTKILFLTVPREQLIARLEARHSSPETFKMRVDKIDRELASSKDADLVIDNRDGKLEQATTEAEAFIRATLSA